MILVKKYDFPLFRVTLIKISPILYPIYSSFYYQGLKIINHKNLLVMIFLMIGRLIPSVNAKESYLSFCKLKKHNSKRIPLRNDWLA